MAEKRKPGKEDAEQSRRFVETAREIETDESGKLFARALKKVFRSPDKSSQD